MNTKEENAPKRCSSYCVGADFNLTDLMKHLRDVGEEPYFYRSSKVMHRVFGTHAGDVFYFFYGTIVTWGLSRAEEEEILSEASFFCNNKRGKLEWEEFYFTVGNQAKIAGEDMTLPDDDVLTKLAFSHGLSQSVKLSVFEHLVESRIENSRSAPEGLAKKGRIPLSRVKLAKMMGEIVLDRNSINLHTDILDTPEFFWEYSNLETLYGLIAQDLDIKSRVQVLNRRLDILKDLFEILSNEIENRYSSTLEWVIIILISIEVVVTFAKDIFKIL